MGKKKTPLRSETAAAAKPRATSSLSMNVEGEARVLELLPKISREENSVEISQKALNVYDALMGLGFARGDVEECIRSTGSCTTEAALDWLCLNLPETRLPAKYRSDARSSLSASREVVIVAAKEGYVPPKEPRTAAVEALDETAVVIRRGGCHKDDDDEPPRASEKSSKDWILNFVEDESSDEDIPLDDVQKPPPPPTPELLAQTEKAFEQAKSSAAAAKSSGDKKAQTDANNLIRKLRGEIEDMRKVLGINKKSTPVSVMDWPDLHPSTAASEPTNTTQHEDTAACKPVANSEQQENEEDVPICGMFDEPESAPIGKPTEEDADGGDMADMFAEPESTVVVPVAALSLDDGETQAKGRKGATQWANSQKKKETATGAPKPNAVPIATAIRQWRGKTPKAMLMEHCQKNKLKKPVWERPDGPGRGQMYCRVQIGGQWYQEEGSPVYPDIVEAENVTATWTLYCLCPDKPLYHTMPPPCRALWQGWLQAAKDKITDAEREEKASRDAFLQQLLAESGSVATTQTTSTSVEGSASAACRGADARAVAAPSGASSHELLNQYRRKQQRESVRQLRTVRNDLPAAALHDVIVDTVASNQVVVISGETGCGKTTQVPQFILDHYIESVKGAECNIVCTQPRRISAMGVAQRVADERGEEPGGRDALVGYSIRLEAKQTATTRLLFCTTGILLRRLQSDPELSHVSHVIVDEVHERDVNTDFLLLILKRLLAAKPSLKVILMSATLNAELFSHYFNNAPVITIPGRSHPVTRLFLEDVFERTGHLIAADGPFALRSDNSNAHRAQFSVTQQGGRQQKVTAEWKDDEEEVLNPYYDDEIAQKYSKGTITSLKRVNEEKFNLDLLEDLVLHVTTSGLSEGGAVLVFLAGLDDIQAAFEQLRHNRLLGNPNRFLILPLHSLVAPADQRKVFQRAPEGVQKIILATNIAETSITIDDVVVVIDGGRLKETQYNQSKHMRCLVETWASQASARQRAGRAGRVRPGHCFHLFSQSHSTAMSAYQTPEILRVPLDELCLQIAVLKMGSIPDVLQSAVSPPTPTAVNFAIQRLIDVKALDASHQLTHLGYHLAGLPVDVQVGKMLLYGAMFRCLDAIATIAAAIAHRSPFVVPFDKREQADAARRGLAGNERSDMFAILQAYYGWRKASEEGKSRDYCLRNFLSENALQTMTRLKSQFFSQLASIGFVPRGYTGEKQPLNWPLVQAVLCAGLYPNVVRIDGVFGGTLSFFGPKDEQVYIHPSSVNHNATVFPHRWLVYNEKIQSNRINLRDSTAVSVVPLVLFGGDLRVCHEESTLTVNEWIVVSCPARTAVLYKQVRAELERVLALKISDPSVDISEAGQGALDVVTLLLTSQ